MPSSWNDALRQYEYKFDLTSFVNAGLYPGWFTLQGPVGNRGQTYILEQHVQKEASKDVAVYLELTFWKMYSNGVARNRKTNELASNFLLPPATSASELAQRAMSFISNPNLQTFISLHSLYKYKTTSIANVATLPAFLDPENFPMIDKHVAIWVDRNYDVNWGHGQPQLLPFHYKSGVLTARHYDQYWIWVEWCRWAAKRLNQLAETNPSLLPDEEPRRWRARDIEMAIFAAKKHGLSLNRL